MGASPPPALLARRLPFAPFGEAKKSPNRYFNQRGSHEGFRPPSAASLRPPFQAEKLSANSVLFGASSRPIFGAKTPPSPHSPPLLLPPPPFDLLTRAEAVSRPIQRPRRNPNSIYNERYSPFYNFIPAFEGKLSLAPINANGALFFYLSLGFNLSGVRERVPLLR